MEAILAKLLVPDDHVIREGTLELKQAVKEPNAVAELCRVLSTSENPQARQYAALLLRKKFSKTKSWLKLSLQERESMKQGCLGALISEPEKPVRHAVVQLVAVLAKYELDKDNWPGLLQFLVDATSNADPKVKRLGYRCLSVLSETAGDEMKSNLTTFVPLMLAALQNETDRSVGFHAVSAITHLVAHVGTDQLAVFQPLVPYAMVVIRALVAAGDERACEAMEIFDELFECEVPIVVPHVASIVDLCLAFAGDKLLEDEVRVKAITFLGRVTRLKKKTIVRHKLYTRIVDVLFPVMCAESADLDGGQEGGVDEPLNQEGSSPAICACQTMDVLAINVSPEKFMPALLRHVEPAVDSNDPKNLVGAYYALAVCAEGCSDHIRTKHLVRFLQLVGSGIKHETVLVRNAALYALGQFSEFLQPEITNYVNEILPVLFGYLDAASCQLASGKKEDRSLDRIFYALKIFTENLGDKLVPFLPELFQRLLPLTGGEFPLHVRQLAVGEIGSAAAAAKAAIVPYFEEILARLKPYLSPEHVDGDHQALLTQSMDALGELAKAVGPVSFAPALAEECCRLGLELVEKHDDPDVRRCAYVLFASVANVAKDAMASALPKLVPLMLLAVSSKEGVFVEYKEEEASVLPVDQLSDEDEDEISLGDDDSIDEAEKVKAVSVENSYVEEKEQAIVSLKHMCVDAGSAFRAYLPTCFEEVWKQIDFPDQDVRKASVEAACQFTLSHFGPDRTPPESDVQDFKRCVSLLVPKLCSMVVKDEEVTVVCVCLEMLAQLLKHCKTWVTANPGFPEEIVGCVHKVMRSECACMDGDEVESDEDQEAELDEVLFEFAGDVLPSLGQAMDPPSFVPYFEGLFPFLLRKAKKRSTAAERSFSVGSFAECMAPLRGQLDKFVPSLMKLFLELRLDEDKDVRNNAIYGLGELALHGGSSMHRHFPQTLHALSNQLGREDDPRCVDQVVGAVCRLIIANKSLVPVGDVVPVIFQHLPLKEDLDEYEIVFRCLQLLYSEGNESVKANMYKILEVSASLIDNEEVDRVKPLLTSLVKQMQKDFPQDFCKLVSDLPPELAPKIGAIVS